MTGPLALPSWIATKPPAVIVTESIVTEAPPDDWSLMLTVVAAPISPATESKVVPPRRSVTVKEAPSERSDVLKLVDQLRSLSTVTVARRRYGLLGSSLRTWTVNSVPGAMVVVPETSASSVDCRMSASSVLVVMEAVRSVSV